MGQVSAIGWLTVVSLALWRQPALANDDGSSDARKLNDFQPLSGGYARKYNARECPVPYFAGNSFEVIDYWPDGANIEVTVRPNKRVKSGWTILVMFSRPLPKGAKILVWNAEESARNHGRYVTLVNRAHNSNLNNAKMFSLTFVIEGATMDEMSGFSAMVSFYAERIKDASCYMQGNEQSKKSPSARPPKPTTRPRMPRRRTTIAPRRTTRKAPARKAGVSRRPTSPKRRVTTRKTTPATSKTTRAPRATPPIPEGTPQYRVSDKMITSHKGRCHSLKKGYAIKNTGYDAGNNLADGQGRKYRFNVEIKVPVDSVVSDWTLKIVFAEPIEAIQTWETVPAEHSSDGTVWLIKPQEWNRELRETAEFLMIPLMRVSYAPPGVVYLCENGDEPTLLGNGIFERKDGAGHKLSAKEIAEQEKEEKERQQRLQRERERLEKERKERERQQNERERKERERKEREERKRNDKNRGHDNNKPRTTDSPKNNWQRPQVTTTARPRGSGPRCSGRDGYAPVTTSQTIVSYKKSPANERRPYDYNEVLTMSIMFYEAQRSGKLPKSNRIPWRGDSGMKDGCDVGHDLTGGWYDAGDHVKFGFPMAWSATTLAWGAIEFLDAYRDAGELNNMLSSLKWVADYFVKAHTGKYELYGQIGDGGADHSYWGKAEDMKMKRPAFKITKNNPGTELAAETAAALAAISIVFKSQNPGYSRLLLGHAVELYEFADKYRAEYHTSISGAQGYYRSYSGYNDELVWGALWLAKATGKQSYLTDGVGKYNQYGGSATPKMFSWDDKRAGSQVLIAQLTGQEKYIGHVLAYQKFLRNYGTTPKGMVWLDQWGSNRYAANAAFISLAAANLKPALREKQELIKWARKQIHLMLGDAGRSYVVGYGRNPPVRPHHRSSSCPPPPRACDWNSAFNNPGGNYFTLYGALVGGPSNNGGYVDKRSDYVANEVATDFNAGFQSALAGLKHFQIEQR